MANHDLAIDTLLNKGLRNRKLDEVLASNCVMDWFGRTFIGQHKVVSFYQNSNTKYEHAMSDVKTAAAFEERPYHLLTREQPQENTTTSLSMNEDEQWFDCDTSVDLKEGQRTPVRRSTTYQCPPAPCRNGLKFQASVDHLDFDDSDDDDTSESNESGICPLEGSFEGSFVVQETKKSHVTKRQRREEKREQTTMQSTSLVESKFSELHYLEATGSVSINRQPSSSDEMEKRECKLLVSYRVHKEDPDVIQIALVVYKSNSKNLKTRRNLMPEFASKASSSKCRTAVKDREVFDATAFGSSSAPPGAKSSKCVKRKMNPVRL